MSQATSRSSFVQRAGATIAGTVLAGVPALRESAQAASALKVGFISPRTGPLAGFGEGDPFVLDLARKALARGFTIGGKPYAVEILDEDTQSDPGRAAQLAKQLITSGGIDLMLTTSTPETVNPVSDACEAAGVPCLGTIIPWESWYFGRGAKPGAPSPFKWTYLFSFGSKQFLDAYISQWYQIATNRKVAMLAPNDADGNAIRHALFPTLEKAGFTIVDAGPYEDGTSDFSAQIAKFKAEKCEIFSTFPIPPDFATFWRQAAQQGLTKSFKISTIAKTGLFPSSIEALGSLGDKLSTCAYWHPDFPYASALTHIGSRELADSYEKTTGRQWIQQLGASMSLLDAGFTALKNSGNPTSKAAVAKALGALKTTTMVGKIDFTSGPVPNVSPTVLIGAQWLKDAPGSKYPFKLVLVEHVEDPKVPVKAKLLPYS